MEIDTTAPVITRDEIVVEAAIDTVWSVQTNVARWPEWQPDVDEVQVDGPLEVGSVFRWKTAGLDITATVVEVDAPHRVVWGGPAQGITAVHVWTLEETAQGVLVKTQESWTGEPVTATPRAMQQALDASLHAWLHNLKTAAEGVAQKTP